ncbi:MAG TPA: hypothetical protein VNW54_11230 [Granulicella sp.]|jgi:hypothetical protein|nr:hypothetical protein [Granulicella sp.]
MSLPRIQIGRPQRLAGLLLLVFLIECLWVVNRQALSPADYRYGLCGREMWERPSPLAGYFTTCGNLNGDGTFAYRVAGLPLTVERLAMLGGDQLRAPAERLYAGGTLNGSIWETRHQIGGVKYLIHLPFILFAVWLGGGLWWVCRRLFGNEGGFFALGLYCFCPAVIRYAVMPNNEVLAMWGLYGLVYAAMGVAHAMQGPRRRWKPRIALFVLALGLTAAAHLLAAMLGFVASFAFLFYLSERRRSYVMQLLIYSALGALLIVFASFAFRLAPFSYVFTGGAGRFWFSLDAVRGVFGSLVNAPIAVAFAVASVLYLGVRRSRYFGNTAPLLMLLALFSLRTTQAPSYPWLWTLPFLFTFVGGVFADALETNQRKLFLGLTGSILVTQALLCVAVLPELAR